MPSALLIRHIVAKLLTNPTTFYNKKWTNQVVKVH